MHPCWLQQCSSHPLRLCQLPYPKIFDDSPSAFAWPPRHHSPLPGSIWEKWMKQRTLSPTLSYTMRCVTNTCHSPSCRPKDAPDDFLRLPAMVGSPSLDLLFDTGTGSNEFSTGKFSLPGTGVWLCGRFPLELIPAEDVGCLRSSRFGSPLLERWPRDRFCIEDVVVVWDELLVADISGNNSRDGNDNGGSTWSTRWPSGSPSWGLKQSRAAWAAS